MLRYSISNKVKIMDIENLKQWIANNLQYSRGLICKKCKREWFEKYGFIDQWDRIHVATQFLDNLLPTFPQRVWHIVNDSLTVKCNNPSCQNTPQFWSFNVGYLRTCSNSCAQYDPNTINKIQATNLKKIWVQIWIGEQRYYIEAGSYYG